MHWSQWTETRWTCYFVRPSVRPIARSFIRFFRLVVAATALNMMVITDGNAIIHITTMHTHAACAASKMQPGIVVNNIIFTRSSRSPGERERDRKSRKYIFERPSSSAGLNLTFLGIFACWSPIFSHLFACVATIFGPWVFERRSSSVIPLRELQAFVEDCFYFDGGTHSLLILQKNNAFMCQFWMVAVWIQCSGESNSLVSCRSIRKFNPLHWGCAQKNI